MCIWDYYIFQNLNTFLNFAYNVRVFVKYSRVAYKPFGEGNTFLKWDLFCLFEDMADGWNVNDRYVFGFSLMFVIYFIDLEEDVVQSILFIECILAEVASLSYTLISTHI